jgi:hypothetical protein
MKRFIILTLSLILITASISGQQTCKELSWQIRNEMALSALGDLKKDGILAIKIPGYNVQISELTRLLSGTEMSEDSRKKLEKKRESYIEDRDSWRELLMTAFENEYTFSKVAFYYDFNHEYVDNPDSEIWLKKDGSLFASKDMFAGIAMYLEQGVTPVRQLPAFILKSKEGNMVCSPLSSYFLINKLSSVIFIGNKARQKKANKLVRTIHSHFAQFM